MSLTSIVLQCASSGLCDNVRTERWPVKDLWTRQTAPQKVKGHTRNASLYLFTLLSLKLPINRRASHQSRRIKTISFRGFRPKPQRQMIICTANSAIEKFMPAIIGVLFVASTHSEIVLLLRWARLSQLEKSAFSTCNLERNGWTE